MRTLDYVILYVDDLEAATAFLRDAIGLPHKLTRHGYAEFASGPTKLGLLERSRASDLLGREASSAGLGGEVLFLVDDVDAEAARLREAGVEALSGPADRPWGHRTLHVTGPDGIVVELAQEIERSSEGAGERRS